MQGDSQIDARTSPQAPPAAGAPSQCCMAAQLAHAPVNVASACSIGQKLDYFATSHLKCYNGVKHTPYGLTFIIEWGPIATPPATQPCWPCKRVTCGRATPRAPQRS